VIYAFIQAQKANHRVSVMCRTLKVSNSGFYGWRDRAPSARAQSDALLTEKISRIHRDSRETYGAPRIHFELRTLGVRCARKRVARLMREAGLFGCGGRRRKARTTLRSHTERTPPAPDLVKRNFTPEAPDRLWVADWTCIGSVDCLRLRSVTVCGKENIATNKPGLPTGVSPRSYPAG
jgi:putative transposase